MEEGAEVGQFDADSGYRWVIIACRFTQSTHFEINYLDSGRIMKCGKDFPQILPIMCYQTILLLYFLFRTTGYCSTI